MLHVADFRLSREKRIMAILLECFISGLHIEYVLELGTPILAFLQFDIVLDT